jgi:hypothetical protein
LLPFDVDVPLVAIMLVAGDVELLPMLDVALVPDADMPPAEACAPEGFRRRRLKVRLPSSPSMTLNGFSSLDGEGSRGTSDVGRGGAGR